MANLLSADKQTAIIAAIECITGVHRDRIMRSGARVGDGLPDVAGFQDAGLGLPEFMRGRTIRTT